MKSIHRDNRGVALITVVIGVMFCLLLTSTMLRVSMLGLQSRSINNQVSDTYYDAESMVDLARTNLQNITAEAWATTSNGVADSSQYVKKVFKLLTGADYPANGIVVWDSDWEDDIISALEGGTTLKIAGGHVESVDGIEQFFEGSVLSGITIKGVQFEYTNPTTGMVSNIKTDVTLRAPLLSSTVDAPLASYSMFAGAGMTVGKSDNNTSTAFNNLGYLEQIGNVYIGYETWHNATETRPAEADAMTIDHSRTVILSGNSVIINGNVYIKGQSSLQLTGTNVWIKGKIYLGPNCHLIISENVNVYCQDVRFCDSDSNAKYNAAESSYRSLAKGEITQSYYNYSLGEPRRYYTAFYKNGPKKNNISECPEYYANQPTSIVVVSDYKTDDLLPAKMNSTFEYNRKRYFAAYSPAVAASTKRVKNLVPSMTSEDLQPVQNTNGYDVRFQEIIDIKVFQKWQNLMAVKNGKHEAYLKAGQYDVGTTGENKYKYTAKSNDGTSYGTHSNDSKKEARTLDIYKYTYKAATDTWEKSATPEVSYDFGMLFVAAQVSIPVNQNDKAFCVSNQNIQINMDGTPSLYCGIFITSGKVTFQKTEGFTEGKSILELDTDEQHRNLKEYIKKAAVQVTSIKPNDSDEYTSDMFYVIYNNLFKEGMYRAFIGDESAGGGGGNNITADTEYNSGLDLIDITDYEKN